MKPVETHGDPHVAGLDDVGAVVVVRRDHQPAGRSLNAAASRSARLAPDAMRAVIASMLLIMQAGEVPWRRPRPSNQTAKDGSRVRAADATIST